MPAKKQIEKEDIISAALQLVRERGIEGLNMRDVAKRCFCSTQPIYLSFKNADELKLEVGKKIEDLYRQRLKAEIEKGKYPPYKATGVGYIMFAKEERKLFKFLFMRDRTNESVDEQATDFESAVKDVQKTLSVSADVAEELHTYMWVYVHGIATMCATGFLDWSEEQISEMLTGAFKGIKAYIEN